jgi:hypothetical protein
MRSKHGQFHPEKWFRNPLWDAFEELGTSVNNDNVHEWLEPRLKPKLFSGDFERVNNGQYERWWEMVNGCRQRLSDEGLVHPGPQATVASGTYTSPLGLWELTEKGKEYLEIRKAGREGLRRFLAENRR